MNFKKMIRIKWLICLIFIPSICFANKSDLDYKYLGVAVETKGKHVWGSSPVIGPDGKVHLYVAQWSIDSQNDFSGWFKDCEIAHYVGDSPEGPFKFVRVAVPDQDGSFNSPHNPTITHIDGRYVLSFIVNENNDLTTQRIVMYVADDLNDNWKPAAGAEADGTMLRKASQPGGWNYTARLGVSNPSLIKVKDKYFLYHKSVIRTDPKKPRGSYTYGVSISDNLEGPYAYHSKQVTPERMGVEDAYAFTMDNTVYLLSRDFGRSKGTHGGGLLWKSEDGLSFPAKDVTRSFEELSHYVGKKALSKSSVYRGDLSGRLERPQVLSIDGKPEYVYLATGINTTPNHGSRSHIFKIIK